MKEFWTQKRENRTLHIKHIRLSGGHSNNKMERLNGEIRTGKRLRGLKKTDSPLLKGYQIYHNYVRLHMGLDGKTPADVAGIKIHGANKWQTNVNTPVRAAVLVTVKMIVIASVNNHHHFSFFYY